MADQERNAKRAATVICELRKEEHVALGDLTSTNTNTSLHLPSIVCPLQKPTPEIHKQKREIIAQSKSTAALSPETENDPQYLVSDIYEFLRKLEVDPSKRPLPNYIQKIQRDINPNNRSVVIDWLVMVAMDYKFVSNTLHLSVFYIDRFLSLNYLSKHKLQLLGVSSMMIASKYVEMKSLEVEECCFLTALLYSKEEVVTMEADILKSLKFELAGPTVKTFLRRFSTVVQESVDVTSDSQFELLSCYLAELSLLDYNCVKFLPSLVAASVVFLARFILNPKANPWNSALHQLTRYKCADLKECALNIYDLYLGRKCSRLQNVREKYKQQKFYCVAKTPSPPEIPLSFFEF